MKRNFIYCMAVALVAIAFTACGKDGDKDDDNAENSSIRMTAAAGTSKIGLQLAGNGRLSVDWGDGNTQNVNLVAIPEYYEHTYAASQTERKLSLSGAKVEFIDCSENSLTELDVSKNSALKYLYCKSNRLESLDLSQNTALNILSFGDNQLETINLFANIVLMTLDCSKNRIATLDLSKNMVLIDLNCDDNSIASLDITKNTMLEVITCSRNLLTALDVSKNKVLTDLECDDNSIASLNFVNNIALGFVHCFGNQLSTEALNATFESLHANPVGSPLKNIYIGGNPGANNCTRAIATNKGWKVH